MLMRRNYSAYRGSKAKTSNSAISGISSSSQNHFKAEESSSTRGLQSSQQQRLDTSLFHDPLALSNTQQNILPISPPSYFINSNILAQQQRQKLNHALSSQLQNQLSNNSSAYNFGSNNSNNETTCSADFRDFTKQQQRNLLLDSQNEMINITSNPVVNGLLQDSSFANSVRTGNISNNIMPPLNQTPSIGQQIDLLQNNCIPQFTTNQALSTSIRQLQSQPTNFDRENFGLLETGSGGGNIVPNVGNSTILNNALLMNSANSANFINTLNEHDKLRENFDCALSNHNANASIDTQNYTLLAQSQSQSRHHPDSSHNSVSDSAMDQTLQNNY